ncbi:hypothetical protein BN59_03022 [Legionella massiliensis]|uniref:Uncharacterized protein n=1 Tax=Legionella massiliensis TaxID=1034943 RepID=A0A078KW71_9GAMM|nr:hypothetical protein [Legionella massiliensis]CDZ78710.1 hypothetical protein BN59_03022 [Legionella massiliensis]CEE14448.1 hypothetical protein BN1094_03022 [Legionella massiliensis]
MTNKIKHVNSNHFILILPITALLSTPFFLFIDSPYAAKYFSQGQDIANIIMVSLYCLFLFTVDRKLYWLIFLMTLSSLYAEILGSLILSWYQYRLKNIPMYIPLGHAVLYATTYQISRQPIIWKYHKAIESSLTKLIFIISFMSLILLRDIAGFLCFLMFLLILRTRKKPLFYLCMFILVYNLEFLGTTFLVWSWYGTLGNHPNYPSIGPFPSGIAGLYLLIDLCSNSIYFYILKSFKFIHKIRIKGRAGALTTQNYLINSRTTDVA